MQGFLRQRLAEVKASIGSNEQDSEHVPTLWWMQIGKRGGGMTFDAGGKWGHLGVHVRAWPWIDSQDSSWLPGGQCMRGHDHRAQKDMLGVGTTIEKLGVCMQQCILHSSVLPKSTQGVVVVIGG
jgi:hypothetical protein